MKRLNDQTKRVVIKSKESDFQNGCDGERVDVHKIFSLLCYNLLQVKYIICYAKHLGLDNEMAARLWVDHGLAQKFSSLYRQF